MENMVLKIIESDKEKFTCTFCHRGSEYLTKGRKSLIFKCIYGRVIHDHEIVIYPLFEKAGDQKS